MEKVNDGTKGYKLASSIYDPILEPGLRSIRAKTVAISGVKEKDRVLDVCCGTGRQTEVYADTGASVVGIDLSEYMIAKAKTKERDNLTFFQEDATNLPYEDSYFDCSSSGYAYHEISEELRIKFLNEMMRVTKDGGKIVLIDFSIPETGGFRAYYYRMLYKTLERIAGVVHYGHYREWMETGGLKGFLTRNNIKIETTALMAAGNISISKVINIKTHENIHTVDRKTQSSVTNS